MRKILKVFIISILMILCGCTNSSPSDKNEYVEENDQIFKDIPNKVSSKAENVKNKLSKESQLEFELIGARQIDDYEVGDMYDIWYGSTMNSTVQLRLYYDFQNYKLTSICIIMCDNDRVNNVEVRNLFNNQLKPAFLKFDFERLFEGRKFERTKKSDDENDMNGKLYLEYITYED